MNTLFFESFSFESVRKYRTSIINIKFLSLDSKEFYQNPDGPAPLSVLLEEFYDDSTWGEKKLVQLLIDLLDFDPILYNDKLT